MYKVTFYYADGTEKVEIKDWRFLPAWNTINRDNCVAYRVEKPTDEELRAAGY